MPKYNQQHLFHSFLHPLISIPHSILTNSGTTEKHARPAAHLRIVGPLAAIVQSFWNVEIEKDKPPFTRASSLLIILIINPFQEIPMGQAQVQKLLSACRISGKLPPFAIAQKRVPKLTKKDYLEAKEQFAQQKEKEKHVARLWNALEIFVEAEGLEQLQEVADGFEPGAVVELHSAMEEFFELYGAKTLNQIINEFVSCEEEAQEEAREE